MDLLMFHGPSHGPSPPVAVQERGSHGSRVSVELEGAASAGLFDNGAGTVVVVVEGPAPP